MVSSENCNLHNNNLFITSHSIVQENEMKELQVKLKLFSYRLQYDYRL